MGTHDVSGSSMKMKAITRPSGGTRLYAEASRPYFRIYTGFSTVRVPLGRYRYRYSRYRYTKPSWFSHTPVPAINSLHFFIFNFSVSRDWWVITGIIIEISMSFGAGFGGFGAPITQEVSARYLAKKIYTSESYDVALYSAKLRSGECDISVFGGPTNIHACKEGAHVYKGHILHYLIMCGYGDVVRYFCDDASYLNLLDNNGNTPLMQATFGNRVATVEALRDAGARTDVVNENGQTAVAISASRGFNDLSRYLLRSAVEDSKRQKLE